MALEFITSAPSPSPSSLLLVPTAQYPPHLSFIHHHLRFHNVNASDNIVAHTADHVKEATHSAHDKLKTHENNEATAYAASSRALVAVRRLTELGGRMYSSPLKAFKPVQQSPLETLKRNNQIHKQKHHDTHSSTSSSSPSSSSSSSSKSSSSSSAHKPTFISASSNLSQTEADTQSLVSTVKQIHSHHGKTALLKHIIPPLIFNALLGTVLFTTYQHVIDAELQYVSKHYPDSQLARFLGYKVNLNDGSRWSQEEDENMRTRDFHGIHDKWSHILSTTASSHVHSESNDSRIQSTASDSKLYMSSIALAGLASGCMQALITCPMDVTNSEIEILSQDIKNVNTDTDDIEMTEREKKHEASKSKRTTQRRVYATAQADIMTVGTQYVKDHGILSLWNGLRTTLLRDAVGITTFFTSYETVKAVLTHKLDTASSDTIPDKYKPSQNTYSNASIVVVSGSIAGILYRAISQPFYSLQHMLLMHRATVDNPNDPIRYHDLIMKHGGYRQLWKSMPSRIMRIFSPAVIGLFAYELAKDSQQRQHQQAEQ